MLETQSWKSAYMDDGTNQHKEALTKEKMVEVHDQLLDWTYENVPFHILTINSFVKVYEVMGGYYETGYRPPTTNEF